MSDVNFHNQLWLICKNSTNIKIDEDFIEIDYSDESITFARIHNVEFERIGNDKLRYLTKSFKVKVINKMTDLLLMNKVPDNLLIYDEVLSYHNGITYINFNAVESDFLIKNIENYLLFKTYLKSLESDSGETFSFVDAYNIDARKLTFVSSSEKGRVVITYDKAIPLYDRSIDYSLGYHKFIQCFDERDKTLIKFLKSSLINNIFNYPSNVRFQKLFENLSEIVDKARINFEVYLNDLSIEKVRKEYDDIISKYFNNLSETLSKLSQSILAIPIGITASILAVSNIETELFLYFLAAALVITSIYSGLLLRVQIRDVYFVEKTFHSYYDSLISNNFFLKFPEEIIAFNEIRRRLEDKTTYLKQIIHWYFWIVNTSNIAIVFFVIYKVTASLVLVKLCVLPMIFLMYIFQKIVFEERGYFYHNS